MIRYDIKYSVIFSVLNRIFTGLSPTESRLWDKMWIVLSDYVRHLNHIISF